uniref:Reverse transcriptase domain-containing protein n=1 Tax=Panagrellus redivivus TaxID=6233 RepID=A0A7E4ZTJ8_PANRE
MNVLATTPAEIDHRVDYILTHMIKFRRRVRNRLALKPTLNDASLVRKAILKVRVEYRRQNTVPCISLARMVYLEDYNYTTFKSAGGHPIGLNVERILTAVLRRLEEQHHA